MTRTVVNVKLKENSYKIVIGDGILSRLGHALKTMPMGRDAVIVTMPLIQKLHSQSIVATLRRNGFSVKIITVPDRKDTKSLRVATQVLNEIIKYDIKKKIFIIALGGGVIGDLVGFVAAIYKRGVPYVHVPTTLLAQIDSAIGGKTAVDLLDGKNLIGAFYQPKIVWTDVATLKKLPKEQMRNGLAEAVKYGIIKDQRLFAYIERHYKKILSGNAKFLLPLLVRCSQIKANVVMRDEKETKGIRTILNFGHTVGHAIEAASHYRYDHGEAVALGMRVASDISAKLGLLSKQGVERINGLLDAIRLPRKIEHVSLTNILRIMEHDKKFRGGTNRFVLATRIGHVKVVEGIPLAVIHRAIQRYS